MPMTTTWEQRRITNQGWALAAARAHLSEAREHYEAFCESMRALGREVRKLDEWQYQRVDAYPGWEGSRDVGGGVDMAGWLDEMGAFLEGRDEA